MKIQWHRVIAVWEIAGGAIGFYVTLPLLFQYLRSDGYYAPVVAIVFLVIYAMLFVGGLLLWNGKPLGENLSLIVQALQIPRITTEIYIYQLLVIFSLQIGVRDGSGNINYAWGNIWRFGKLYSEEPTRFLLNILAILSVAYLIYNKGTLEDRPEEIERKNKRRKNS